MLPPQRIGTVTDVFACSRGISRLAWRLARSLYRYGSAGGARSSLYSMIRRRTDYSGRSSLLQIMACDIQRRFRADPSLLVVGHPCLVGILRNRPSLIYQHGELVAPSECRIAGDHWTFVPCEGLRPAFSRGASSPDRVVVTGLCIEPALAAIADDAYAARQQRLSESKETTGALLHRTAVSTITCPLTVHP